MGSFREHIAFSSLLGLGYGAGAGALLGFSAPEASLAGFLTAVGGMLPDLDSPNARPGQEIFSVTAAVAPLVLVGHVLQATGLPADTETIMLLMLTIYFTVRYGLAWLVNKLSVHRGMFHSFPAMLIAAELTWLAYPSENLWVKLLMGVGVAVGFFSHLLLDEMYSVQWSGALPSLKKSFGTAMKFASPSFGPTAFTYGLLMLLTFVVAENAGIIGPPLDPSATPLAGDEAQQEHPGLAPVTNGPVIYQQAGAPEEGLTDAPLFR